MPLNPLAQINLITIVALMAIFVATYFILRKIFFLPIIEVMEKRTKKIGAARARYVEAWAVKSNAQREAERILAEAGEEAEHITEEAKEEITRVREAKVAQANAEADGILAKGREEIVRLKESEQAKLREDLFSCVNQTLTKLVGKVDERTVHSMVNKVLAAREAGE
ncbi:MAG: ATP synthase F0 subunit B [Actinomycetota bacterium]